MIDPEILSRAPLLASLAGSAREIVVREGVVTTVSKGRVLWTAGSPAKGLYLLLSGRVRVVRGFDGRQHLVHIERPGGTLGEVPLFDGRGYPATAVTASECRFLVLPPETVYAALKADPEFARLLLDRLSRRVRGLVDRLHANTLMTVRARLAAYLLGEATLHAGIARLDGTQSELAENLGCAREVVARELAALAREGLITKLDARRFRVEDEAGLEEVAGQPAANSAPGA